MTPEERQEIIRRLEAGEELSPEWARVLFPPEKREYELASNGECPIQIDTGTPSCGAFSLSASTGERAGVRCRIPALSTLNFQSSTLNSSRVVERDKASEGLFASGDERMEQLIEFRETLLFYQDPANGKRDLKHKTSRISHKRAQSSQRKPLRSLSSFAANQFRTRHSAFRISPARQKGILMSDWKETNRLRELQEQIAAEIGIRADTLRRLLAKVDEFSESHRALRPARRPAQHPQRRFGRPR